MNFVGRPDWPVVVVLRPGERLDIQLSTFRAYCDGSLFGESAVRWAYVVCRDDSTSKDVRVTASL